MCQDVGVTPHPRPDSTFAVLRVPSFRWLWLGQISHAGALWMEQVARPFLILEITDGSASHLGAVVAVRTLPQLVFGLTAGVVTDWFDRRAILLAVKSSVLAVNAVFAALVVGGWLELWHVYAYALLRGSLMAFDQPARQSMIPSIVPAGRVVNAMALLSATQNTMRIAGATIGGLLYAAFGAGGAFSAITAVYVGAVVFTWLLDVPAHERPGDAGLAAMRRGFAEGVRFALAQPAIRGVLLLSLVYFTFGMSWMQVFLPLFADRVLEIGSAGFGAMGSASGAGALVTAIWIARRPPRRLGALLPALVISFGVLVACFSLATYLARPLGLLLPFLLIPVLGGLQTSFFSLSRSLMLEAAPDYMRGRVLSLLSFDRAFMTAGAATAGLLAAAIGVQPSQILYGALCVLGGATVLGLATRFRDAAEPGEGAERAPG